jgi:hypothetical protein
MFMLLTRLSFGQELTEEYRTGITNLINHLKKGNKKLVAEMVSYPFPREYPIPPVQNEQAFVARFDEIFDNTLKQRIINSKPSKDWSEVGWRGVMLHDGEVWIDSNVKLAAINYQSETERKMKVRLIEADRARVHSSLKKFKKPVYILETSKYRIRIDETEEGIYRYASWSIGKSMREKPDLVISSGEMNYEGTGGNHTAVFKNKGFVYECAIIVLGAEDSPPAMLTIYEGERKILSQKAKIIGR